MTDESAPKSSVSAPSGAGAIDAAAPGRAIAAAVRATWLADGGPRLVPEAVASLQAAIVISAELCWITRHSARVGIVREFLDRIRAVCAPCDAERVAQLLDRLRAQLDAAMPVVH